MYNTSPSNIPSSIYMYTTTPSNMNKPSPTYMYNLAKLYVQY